MTCFKNIDFIRKKARFPLKIFCLTFFKQELNEENPANIAELFEELSGEKQLFLFRLLTKDAAAEAFSYMDSDMQEHIVQSITDNEVRNIV